MIEGEQAPIQSVVYVFGNLVMVAMAVYKCHTMGLLPTYASDWLSFIQPSQVNFLVIFVFFNFFCSVLAIRMVGRGIRTVILLTSCTDSFLTCLFYPRPLDK